MGIGGLPVRPPHQNEARNTVCEMIMHSDLPSLERAQSSERRLERMRPEGPEGHRQKTIKSNAASNFWVHMRLIKILARQSYAGLAE